jgi:F0F1-type ATP synthase assembly protein I
MLVALVLVFTGLGYFLDRWLDTGPWLVVGGVFVGAGLGFLYLVFILFAGSSGGQDRKKQSGDYKEPEER